MEAQYVVPTEFLTGVADEVRRLTETEDALTTDAMLEALEGVTAGEVIVDAEGVTFYPDEIAPDVVHKIGYNWFAQVVKLVQPMVNAIKGMTPDDIVANLARIQYTPLAPAASAESVIPYDLFIGDGSSLAPVVSRGGAKGTIPADAFISAAVGGTD